MEVADPSLIFGKYALIRRIAIGGMGEIFLARQTGAAGFQRLVILKSLRPEIASDQTGLTQFLNEARIAATLNHPNIVAIYEVDLYRNVYLLAMEYIEGIDLAGLIRQSIQDKRPIPVAVAAALVRDAALGLDHAHNATDERGVKRMVIHRDVSPQNLMVRLDGVVKVVDFGIAKSEDSARTKGGFQGKFGYVSPEQIAGEKLDGRCDQYALGIVFWELLTRRRLFKGDPSDLVKRAHSSHIPPPRRINPEVSEDVQDIILRMLSTRREDRFPSLADVAEALRKVLREGTSQERDVATFVKELVGEAIIAKTRDLTPTQVSIDGLTPVGAVRCPACRRLNAVGNKFCADCGAGMVATYEMRTDGGTALSALAGEAARLRVSLSSEEQTVTVIDGRIHGRDTLLRTVSPEVLRTAETQLIATLGKVVEAHGAQIERLTPDGFTVVMTESKTAGRSSDPTRTMEAIQRALSETNRTLPARLHLALGVERGPAQVRPLGKGRVKVDGLVVNEARRLSQTALAEGAGDTVRIGTGAARQSVSPASGAQTSGALVGRQAELRTLFEALTIAEGGQVVTKVLCGPPGSGKTRLLTEVAREAQARGFQVVELAGASSSGLELLRRLVRAVAAQPGGEKNDLYAELSKLGASTGGLQRIRSLLTGTFELDDSVTSDEKLRSDTTIGRLLSASSAGRPLLLAIDDLHLGDHSSLELISRLPERITDGHLALVFTASPELARTGPLSEHKLELWSLAPEATLAMALSRLGPVRAVELDRWLLERASGNPGLTAALLDGLAADGAVVDDSWWTRVGDLRAEGLPSTLRGFAEAAVDKLSPAALIFLGIGAHSGAVFNIDWVAKAISSPVSQVIDECVAARLLKVHDGERLSFHGAHVRAVVLARYSPDEAVRIHARLAEVLQEEAKINPRTEVLEALARHLLASTQGTGGVPAIVRSADQLRKSGAAEEAAQLYRGALQLLIGSVGLMTADAAGSVYGVLARGVPMIARTEPVAGLELIDDFLGRIPAEVAPLARAEVLRQRALLEEKRGRLHGAQADLEKALALANKDVDPELYATILGDMARMFEGLGRLDEATALVGESLEVMAAREARNRHFYWKSLNALGRLSFQANQLEKAREMFELARSQAERVDSSVGQATALTNLASAFVVGGQADQAAPLLDQAAALAQGASDAIGMARIEYNRGRLLLGKHDVTAARRALSEAERLSRESGWTEGRAIALQMLDGLLSGPR